MSCRGASGRNAARTAVPSSFLAFSMMWFTSNLDALGAHVFPSTQGPSNLGQHVRPALPHKCQDLNCSVHLEIADHVSKLPQIGTMMLLRHAVPQLHLSKTLAQHLFGSLAATVMLRRVMEKLMLQTASADDLLMLQTASTIF